MKRTLHGSAQNSPSIALEIVGVRLLQLSTGLTWGGDWVAFESFKCRLCGEILEDVDIGQLCGCGCMVCSLSKYNEDPAITPCVWERETLE